MFEMARDDARLHTDFEVVGGYLSLVNDAYRKPGLAAATHRYNMCRLACDKTSDWLMVDPFEARQDQYVPTAPVLDHFDEEINKKRGGVSVLDNDGNDTGRRKQVRIILLAGSDLIQTMSEPGVWAEQDVSLFFTLQRARMTGQPGFFWGWTAHNSERAVLFSSSSSCLKSPSSTTSWDDTAATSSSEPSPRSTSLYSHPPPFTLGHLSLSTETTSSWCLS